MQTAEQVLEIIRKLPSKEQEWLRDQIQTIPKDKLSDDEWQKAVDDLLSLSGCVDVGKFRNPLPDREWMYGEQD